MHQPVLTAAQQSFIDQTFTKNRGLFGATVMTAPAGDPAGQTVVIPSAPPTPAPAAVPQRVDMNDPAVIAAIEAARKQEKDKLYDTIEQERQARQALEQRMEAFSTDLTARQEAEQAAIQAAAQAAEEKRLAELSFGEKLSETEARLAQRQAELEQQLAQRDALLEKERQFNALMDYRRTALESEVGQSILPELRDLVTGNTVAEIDASVSALAERSGSILDQMAQATGAARQTARGVGVTAPPVGPLDNNSGHQTLSNEELRDMDMTQYAQLRGRLLGAAATQQRERGMFG